jgi:hypothetical protein
MRDLVWIEILCVYWSKLDLWIDLGLLYVVWPSKL